MNSINSDSSGSASRLVEIYRNNQDFATFDPKHSIRVEATESEPPRAHGLNQ